MGRRGAAAGFLVFALVGAARAQGTNFRPYLVGARAAGMGGAFTALADDGSGPYYNPGGLAFVESSQLSLAASVYGRVSGTSKDALGDGHDFQFSNLNAFPMATAGVWKLDDADVFSLSAFVPDAQHVNARDQLFLAENAFFEVFDQQTIWLGATFARRFGRLGVGASTFLLIGNSSLLGDLTLTVPGTSPPQFGTITARTDETILGLVGAAGVRWDATDRLRLGASVFSPEVGLGQGNRSLFARVAVTGDIAVVNLQDLHASPTMPLRAQLGAAWSDGPWTFSADAMLLAARETIDDADRAAYSRRSLRRRVVNASLGAEYVAAGMVPLRAGAFTDFDASPKLVDQPPGSPGNGSSNSQHTDRFGGSFSVGLRTEHTSTDLGLNFAVARGQSLEARNLDFNDLVVRQMTEFDLYVFIASAYRF